MEISPGFKWVSFKQNDTLLHKVFIKSFESVRKFCFPNVHFLYLPLPKPTFTYRGFYLFYQGRPLFEVRLLIEDGYY